MKQKYLGTFSNNNLEKVVENLTSEINDIVIETKLNRSVVFTTSKNINRLSSLDYLNSVFLVIKQFDDLTGTYFKPIFQWSGRHSLDLIGKKGKELGYKSFRLVLKDKNRKSSSYRRAVKSLENKISKETGMRVDRVSPDSEVWILYTKEKYGFILLKI
jgi:hypothetical protein